jgi:hypothetical protein
VLQPPSSAEGAYAVLLPPPSGEGWGGGAECQPQVPEGKLLVAEVSMPTHTLRESLGATRRLARLQCLHAEREFLR